jgi:hypothetical protein
MISADQPERDSQRAELALVRPAGRPPLQIATVAAPGVPGAIGLTPCPGKKDRPVAGTAIYLDTDIA